MQVAGVPIVTRGRAGAILFVCEQAPEWDLTAVAGKAKKTAVANLAYSDLDGRSYFIAAKLTLL
jgi:hypothetical protein